VERWNHGGKQGTERPRDADKWQIQEQNFVPKSPKCHRHLLATLEEEQETTKGKKSSIMRTWAKPIEEKKMKILFVRKQRIFCVVL